MHFVLLLCAAVSFHADDLTPLRDFRETGDPDVVVVKDGSARLPILVDDLPRNVAAARELASVIYAVSGVRPEIIRETKGQSAGLSNALCVGCVSLAACADVQPKTDHPEAFRVVVKDGSVFFAGRADYAVYDWCERQLGARCYWRDKDGDELWTPKSADIYAKGVDYTEWPVCSKRICGSCGGQRWAKFAKCGSSHRGGVHVHAPHRWHLDSELVAEHPEIFALTPDGRRAVSPMLCYGNPATLEYYERRIDEAIEGVRDSGGIVDVARKVITVSPWDMEYNCTCGYCTPLYDYSLGEYGYASPIVWGRFLKGLAKWAKEKHPDYMVSFLPYWTMCEVPAGLDLTEEGNCEAEVCVMPGIARLRSAEIKAREERIIREWAKVTGRKAILWHYTCWPAEHTVVPYLFGAVAQRHFSDMRDDLDGVFVCGGGEVPRLSLMYYVMMRCMWNPELDVSAVYDGFARRMFGPAAKPMRRLIELQERGWARKWRSDRIVDGNIYGYAYPPWVVREMKRCIARAEKLTARDPVARRRVRRYAGIFDDFFAEAELVASGFSPAPLTVVRTKDAPCVDGIPDEVCWESAPSRNFVLAFGRTLSDAPSAGTEARAVWTEDGIAFSFKCEEPDVAGMPHGAAQGDYAGQDTLSVVFEIGDVCSHIDVDALGRTSAFCGNVPWRAQGLVAASHIGEGCWSAELFIPFEAIGEDAKTSFVSGGWRGNLIRWRPGTTAKGGEWSRLSTRRSTLNKDRNAFVKFLCR